MYFKFTFQYIFLQIFYRKFAPPSKNRMFTMEANGEIDYNTHCFEYSHKTV